MIYNLNPGPSSDEELLDFLKKICYSDIIYGILGIHAYLHIDLNSEYKSQYLPVINLSTPLAYGYYYYYNNFDYNFPKNKNNDYKNFPINTGISAKKNKIFNLHIEPKEKAEIRLKSCSKNPKYRSVYFLPPGLTGLQKFFHFINKGFIDNENYIGKVVEFSISLSVLWKSWIKFIESKTEEEILYLLGDGEENIEFWLNSDDIILFINSATKDVELGAQLPVDDFTSFIRENWGTLYELKILDY